LNYQLHQEFISICHST